MRRLYGGACAAFRQKLSLPPAGAAKLCASGRRAEEKAAEAPRAEAPKAEKPKQQSKRKTFKERQEFEQLETTLENLNIEKEELEQQMNSGSLSPEAFEAASRRYAELADELDLAELRWLELSEKD